MFTDLSPPPVEPVTLDDAKLFLRIDTPHHDALLGDLIRSAREQVERRASLVLVTRDVRLTLPVCGTRVRLPISPVQSLTEVRVEGETVEGQLNNRPHPAWLHFATRQQGFAEIDLVAGFGRTDADVPVPLRQAILLLVADAFEHREREVGFERVSLRVDALIGPYWGPRL